MLINTRAREGFTFAELMIVLFILGLLMAAIVPGYLRYRNYARMQTTKSSLKTLSQAIDNYDLELNKYPKKLEDLVKPPQGGPAFVNKLPKDGWNNDFAYKVPGKGHPYDLYSYGPNGPEEATPEEYISVWEI